MTNPRIPSPLSDRICGWRARAAVVCSCIDESLTILVRISLLTPAYTRTPTDARASWPPDGHHRHPGQSNSSSSMMAGARDPPAAVNGGAWTTPAARAFLGPQLPLAYGHQPPPQPTQQQQQPPRAAAAVATPPPGLLLIDMPHLREALARYFPQLVAPVGGGSGGGSSTGGGGGALQLEPDAGAHLDVLLPSIVSCLEAVYGTRFTKR